MTEQPIIKLKVPRQDLAAPSQFVAKPESLRKWLESLPMANLGQTTRELYRAAIELNRVQMPPELRLEMLDILRTAILFAGKGLGKHYLNQPIVLPDQANKVYRLANTLIDQLATGYTIAAVHTAANYTFGHRNTLATALHRAIIEHTRNLLRTFQLYQDQPEELWHSLHRLYQLAQQLHITDVEVKDGTDTSSITDSYSRALLLGSARCNQLRQEDMEDVFDALKCWGSLINLSGADANGLFVINLESDDPPIHEELADYDKQDRQWLSMDTRLLVARLTDLREKAGDSPLKVVDNGTGLSPDLISHLILAWGVISKRSFMRHENNDHIDVALGLTASHYFLSGEQSFNHFVMAADEQYLEVASDNPFMKSAEYAPTQKKDVWDEIYTSNIGKTNVALESIDYQLRQHGSKMTDENARERLKCIDIETVNVSAGGFCVRWPDDSSAVLKTGEVLSIRERHHNNWNIGVVRWINHQPNEQTQLGLELLSATAIPYGARVLHKSGPPSDYLRVLMLPEIKQIGRPVVLLTPRVPFREGQKLELIQQGERARVHLTECVASSNAYALFEFNRLQDSPLSKKSGAGDFDSLWTEL